MYTNKELYAKQLFSSVVCYFGVIDSHLKKIVKSFGRKKLLKLMLLFFVPAPRITWKLCTILTFLTADEVLLRVCTNFQLEII